ncbi:MAG: hypothetical protein WCQ32_02715 [bacterium]
MEQNKITTWWKKVLLILIIYIFWWIICFGIFTFQSIKPEGVNNSFLNILSGILILISPISAFWIGGKITKIYDLNQRVFYTLITLIVILGLIGVLLIGLSQMHPEIG